ncbi:MAG: HEAT repeat domain-containing protein [Deltaproteobacteria bacterium]|nr:HEAT repeat domain-containing protein [Nannocystaceae bacterium]
MRAQSATGEQQPTALDPPLVADVAVPTLSPGTLTAWNAFAKQHCLRKSELAPSTDCTPPGHTRPCSARSFESELERCDGSFACLQLAKQVDSCRVCRIDIPDELVRKRIEDVSGDCAGLLRFTERRRVYESDDLLDLAHTPAAIECLAKSKHRQARLLLGGWAKDPIAAKVLVGDPGPTLAWLRHQLSLTRAGRDALFSSWALWNTLDVLGAAADPLLPGVRALATHPSSVGLEPRRYDHEAIRHLGARKDRAAIPLLRRILVDHTDWRAQELAAKALGEIGVDAVVAAESLAGIAREHWSKDVRDRATWAGARVRGEDPPPPPKRTRDNWPHDERCPVSTISVVSDHSGAFNTSHQRWPWRATIGSETIALPDPDHHRPVLPAELAGIDLRARFPDVVEGTETPLTESATVVRPLHDGWVIGTNLGEFGGSLWWFDRRGRVRHLAQSNVKDIVQLGDAIYAIQGLSHLGSSAGSLIRIEDTPHAVQVHHALELPGSPHAWWVRGEELWVATFDGLFAVGVNLDIRALPCHADETYPGTLEDEQIAAAVARVRPSVERCLDALPEPLSCGATLNPSVMLLFRVDGAGSVTSAEPIDFSGMRFPEVEACLAAHAIGWHFGAPKGGATLVGYEFSAKR